MERPVKMMSDAAVRCLSGKEVTFMSEMHDPGVMYRPERRTCARRRGLAHAGGIAVRVGDLLGQFLLGAPVRLVVFLLVLHQDLPHQLHGAR